MREFVYFAKFDNETIKIGISHNLTNRLRQLEGETGRRGSFLGRLDVTEREAPIVERALHRALGSFWLHGEWFTDCPEVRSEIRRLLRDPMAVQAIVDRVRGAARTQRSNGPRPNVRVMVRLAGDIMRARGPECPDMVLDEDLEKACTSYRIPTDESARAKAIRIARARIQQRRHGVPVDAAADAGECHAPLQRVTKVLETLIQRHTYETAADLVEDLKRECAGLHIPYDAGLIHAAIDLGEHGGRRPLVTSPSAAPSPASRVVLEPPVSHREAVNILAALGVRPVPTMTAVRQLSDDEIGQQQWRADQRKAYRMVQQQILETAQRAAALEAAVEAADTAHDGGPHQ
jgi:hypothetical protein